MTRQRDTAAPPAARRRHGRALVVDDQTTSRRVLTELLEHDGWEVTPASTGDEGLQLARRRRFHVVFCDGSLTPEGGRSLLQALHAEQPETVVITLAAHGSVREAVEAMRAGAFDYLTKPLADPDEVAVLARKALEHRKLVDARDAAVAAGPTELIFEHESMARVEETVRRVARADATVLITGESGTGKELVARRLHALSPRAQRPFVAVNCAALAEGLLDSELFGHDKGAFTGADKARRGRFEVADGGTLFLDEVGEMSAALQAKLLRVLQERSFERVGGTTTLDVDVRLVAATHRDLRAEVKRGAFREDLYYRLHVVPVCLPPLRERGRDVVLLARRFLGELGRRYKREALRLGRPAEAALVEYRWPGNVRELRNVVERAAVLAAADVIEPEDLGLPGPSGRYLAIADIGAGMPLNLRELEQWAIRQALDRAGGNRREAAELLGIGLRTLHDKLTRYEMR
jgi:two-component system response regulator FlrC